MPRFPRPVHVSLRAPLALAFRALDCLLLMVVDVVWPVGGAGDAGQCELENLRNTSGWN